jgi:hypothetical protein
MNAPQAVAHISIAAVAAYTLEILPGEFEGKWADAMAWAKEQGGDLPTRIEQIHLFNHARDEFEPDWYWSSEQTPTSAGPGPRASATATSTTATRTASSEPARSAECPFNN